MEHALWAHMIYLLTHLQVGTAKVGKAGSPFCSSDHLHFLSPTEHQLATKAHMPKL